MGNIKLVNITPENILQQGLYCIKNTKAPGFKSKKDWLELQFKNGLQLKILKDENDAQIGFIEYIRAEFAWRPVNAPGYLFIHCILISSTKFKSQGYGSYLIEACETEAKAQNKAGMAMMCSKGPWIAGNTLFEKNGFQKTDELGRFELWAKKLDTKAPDPKLIDWTKNQKKYKGWHLIYSDQCPWHHKSVEDMQEAAVEIGIDLQIKKLTTPQQAQQSPSGFGVYSLIHDGKLLADHYISKTRFKNILKQELKS